MRRTIVLFAVAAALVAIAVAIDHARAPTTLRIHVVITR